MKRAALLGALLWACTTPDPPVPPDMGIVDMPAPRFAEARAQPLLLGVWHDGREAWLAGGLRNAGGVILRGDAVLRRMAVPAGPPLWWIWGHGTQRWAVGEGGRVLRFDTMGWHSEATNLADTAVLWGVWGSGPNDLWSVGGSPRPGGPKGLVLRSTGDGTWRQVTDPALPDSTNLYKVWGASATDVHIVGEAGVALHWNGSIWRRTETGTPDLLFTVHGHSNGLVLAVGGTVNGLILRWNGTRWVDDDTPAGQPPLNGVYVRSDGTAIATGQRGRVLERDLTGRWHVVRVPGDASADTLHAVWAEAPVWMVGGDFFGDGGGWIVKSTPAPLIDETPMAAPDGGLPDAARVDMALDARVADAQPVDARAVDAQPADVRPADADPSDGAVVDAAIPDQAIIDAGPMDARIAICGDGRVDPPEECDDGNRQIADGCDADCRFECGNGRLDPGEACEDGNRDPDDGCDSSCQRECGNGELNGAEECDDGNRERDDGCDRFCALECGNEQLDGVETCDDGNRMAGDGCDAVCQLECGNGQVEGEEACDDGNRLNGDGCSRDCKIERRPGPGELCPDLVCDDTLECWGVADLNFDNYCLRPCNAVEECFDDFGPDACCQPPGPQLLDTFCIPRELLRDPCGE